MIFKAQVTYKKNEKSEQSHIPHAPPLLDNDSQNEWQAYDLKTQNNLILKGHNSQNRSSNNTFL